MQDVLSYITENLIRSAIYFGFFVVIVLGIYFYRNFIKDSLREFKHVVWPTRKETTTYFFLVVTILTLFGIYLFIFSNIFSEILFTLKNLAQ